MAVLSLTEARIRDLPFGSGIRRDEQVKGLLVVCHAATKTDAVKAMSAGTACWSRMTLLRIVILLQLFFMIFSENRDPLLGMML